VPFVPPAAPCSLPVAVWPDARTHRNARCSRDSAQADAARQQWRNLIDFHVDWTERATLLSTFAVSSPLDSIPQCIDDQSKRRGLASAGVEQVVARVSQTPAVQHAPEAARALSCKCGRPPIAKGAQQAKLAKLFGQGFRRVKPLIGTEFLRIFLAEAEHSRAKLFLGLLIPAEVGAAATIVFA
jgi:hypothetical protein